MPLPIALYSLAATTSSLLDSISPETLTGLLAAPAYGAYLSWWKALLFTVVFIGWARLLLWIDKDTLAARMPREIINSAQWVLLLAALLVVIYVPTFVISFTIFVVLFALSVGGYLIWRNQVVGLSDLPEEFNLWLKDLFKSKRVKRFEKKEDALAEGAITLMSSRGEAPAKPEEEDPARPAYDTAHRILNDPLYKGAERIVLASAGERYATKFRVDGFDYPGIAIEPQVATSTIDLIKKLANMDVAERRKQQVGKLKARTALASHDLEVQTSGTRSGETMIIEVDRSARYRQRATALGMSSQQRELLAEVVADNKNIVVGAAPTGGGLTALMYGLVQEHDAFVQHILTLERGGTERELEGTTQTALPQSADAAEETKQVSWISDQLPDVLLTMHLESPNSIRELVRLVGEERKRAYVGMRGSDVADTITKWRQLAGDDKTAFSKLELVIVGRTLRKLCDACKDSYEPGEAVLAKMGVPKGKVRTLYRARTEPRLDERGNPVSCEFCSQLGYKGRLGVFEMLRLDDQVRRALIKDASATSVRNLLRTQKMPTINEAALRAVIAGKTDLQEVQRVMTPGSSSRRPSPQRAAS